MCDGEVWTAVGGKPNGTPSAPAHSCLSLHEDWPTFESGTYSIDPNGGSPIDAFEVHCDMETDGGGWTRVAALSGSHAVCAVRSSGVPPTV